jgi:hypothetical protein
VLEIWDIPGEINPEHTSPLMGTFFHAACICFSLDNDSNIKNVINRVSFYEYASLRSVADSICLLVATRAPCQSH